MKREENTAFDILSLILKLNKNENYEKFIEKYGRFEIKHFSIGRIMVTYTRMSPDSEWSDGMGNKLSKDHFNKP